MEILCGESEEDLRPMVKRFAEMCRRRGLKVNAGKSKVMMLNGEEGLECEVYHHYYYYLLRSTTRLAVPAVPYRCGSEVYVDEIRLEHVSEFKYLGCLFWTNQVQMGQNAV